MLRKAGCILRRKNGISARNNPPGLRVLQAGKACSGSAVKGGRTLSRCRENESSHSPEQMLIVSYLPAHTTCYIDDCAK
jgi:hypothetical protein